MSLQCSPHTWVVFISLLSLRILVWSLFYPLFSIPYSSPALFLLSFLLFFLSHFLTCFPTYLLTYLLPFFSSSSCRTLMAIPWDPPILASFPPPPSSTWGYSWPNTNNFPINAIKNNWYDIHSQHYIEHILSILTRKHHNHPPVNSNHHIPSQYSLAPPNTHSRTLQHTRPFDSL